MIRMWLTSAIVTLTLALHATTHAEHSNARLKDAKRFRNAVFCCSHVFQCNFHLVQNECSEFPDQTEYNVNTILRVPSIGLYYHLKTMHRCQ